jgi:hypothetical protein
MSQFSSYCNSTSGATAEWGSHHIGRLFSLLDFRTWSWLAEMAVINLSSLTTEVVTWHHLGLGPSSIQIKTWKKKINISVFDCRWLNRFNLLLALISDFTWHFLQNPAVGAAVVMALNFCEAIFCTSLDIFLMSSGVGKVLGLFSLERCKPQRFIFKIITGQAYKLKVCTCTAATASDPRLFGYVLERE